MLTLIYVYLIIPRCACTTQLLNYTNYNLNIVEVPTSSFDFDVLVHAPSQGFSNEFFTVCRNQTLMRFAVDIQALQAGISHCEAQISSNLGNDVPTTIGLYDQPLKELQVG